MGIQYGQAQCKILMHGPYLDFEVTTGVLKKAFILDASSILDSGNSLEQVTGSRTGFFPFTAITIMSYSFLLFHYMLQELRVGYALINVLFTIAFILFGEPLSLFLLFPS